MICVDLDENRVDIVYRVEYLDMNIYRKLLYLQRVAQCVLFFGWLFCVYWFISIDAGHSIDTLLAAKLFISIVFCVLSMAFNSFLLSCTKWKLRLIEIKK